MSATLDVARAARQAALRVEQMIIEMLTSNQVGDVTVEVGYGDLQPIKRIEEPGKHIKVSRGQATLIETVG